MAASLLINTFASEFSKFGAFFIEHLQKTNPDLEIPDVDEMVAAYLQYDKPIKKKAAPKKKVASVIDAEVTQVPVKKVTCTAITGKGSQCKRCATEGQVFCSMHLKSNEPKAKKGRAPAKKKKADPPKHSHLIGEKPKEGACDLCDSHGNPVEDDDATQLEVRSEPDPDYVLEEEEFDED